MKTSLEIPDDLVRQVKILAASEGRKLKDVVAQALREAVERKAAKPRPSLRGIRPARVGGAIRPLTAEDDVLGEMIDDRGS